MTKLNPNSLKSIAAALWLWFAFLAHHAGAAVTAWDPEGTNTQSPYYTGDLSGTWESSNWSTTEGVGQASPQNWVEGTAAEFAVNTGTGTPAFTVTMNANHTVAGIYDGPLTPNPCPVTITGTGIITIPYNSGYNGIQGFGVSSDSGDPGSLTIDTVLTGPGTLGAQFNGSIYLNATNTYTGGTQLGWTTNNPFNGTIYFNNSASFGTGGIILSNCLGGVLVVAGTNALTITNAFAVGQTNQSLNLVGNPVGVTFSGPWNLGGFTPAIGSGNVAGNFVTLSGVISGSGSGLSKFNPGILVLPAANSYSGVTTINGGYLYISADASLGTAPGTPVANQLTLNCGTTSAGLRFNANNITLNPNRGIYLDTNGGSINITTGDSGSIPGIISGPGNFSSGANYQTGTGTNILSGANTYSGTTIIAAGRLKLGANGTLPAGTPLTISADNAKGAFFDLGGYSQTVGPLSSSTGIGGLGTGTPTIVLTGALTVNETNSSTFAGAIIGSGGSLTINGNNTLTLTGANTYTGPTLISAGTLALGGGGSISGSTSISLAANATLDVSTAGVTLTGSSPQQTLAGASASGAATISAPSQTVTLSSGALLSFQATGGSTTVGKISVSGAAANLTLNNNPVTINVTGPALAAGSYRLLDCTGALSGAANPAPTITGTPLASGYTATVTATTGGGGHLDLIIMATPAFSGLTASQAITYGASGITLAGRLSAAGPIYPALGEMISVTINGNAQTTTIADTTGDFAFTYHPAAIPASGSAYTIAYSYAGDASLNPAADASTSLTVNKANPNVTAWPTASAITYGQTLASSTLTGGSATPAGTFGWTTPTAAPGAGTAPQSVTFTPTDTVDCNSATSTVSLVVSPAVLTVTANSASRAYGVANPVLSGTITGIQNGDNITVSYGTAATSTSPVGTYPIIPTLVDPSGKLLNYTVTTNNGTLTIGQAPSIITWSTPAAIGYGTALSGAQLNASANVPGSFAYSPALGTVLNAGTATLTAVFTPTDTTDYTTATTNVSVTVNQAPLVVTASSVNKAYDGAAFTGGNGVTYSGFVNGETAAVLGGALSYGGTAQGAVDVGAYSIIPSGLTSANYAISFNNGTLNIGLPPQITSQPTNQIVASGGTAQFSVVATGQPTLTYQWLFNQTNLLAAATNATLTLTNISSAQAGDYSVVVLNDFGATNSTAAVLALVSVPTISGFSYSFPSTNSVTGSRTVTLNATVNPNGLPTSAAFQYGLTASYAGSSAPVDLPALSAGTNVSASLDSIVPGVVYHCRVVASNSLGNVQPPDQTFFAPSIYPPGETNGSGVVDQNELDAVLANYWPNSPWLCMTNVAGLGSASVQFALTNANNWNFSVLVSTNLTDWQYLGQATPMYQFVDPQATNQPTRYYRLQWP